MFAQHVRGRSFITTDYSDDTDTEDRDQDLIRAIRTIREQRFFIGPPNSKSISRAGLSNKMFESIRAMFCKWTPWEVHLLHLLSQKLGDKHRQILLSQVEAINKVQRIVGWAGIDFYVMKRGRVSWDGVPSFFDDREFSLARASTFAGGDRIQSELFCTGGHLFSIESKSPIKPIAFKQDVRIELYDVDKRFL